MTIAQPRVLHILLSMSMGGAETLVYHMVQHSSFAGNKPVICCLKSVGELGERLKDEGFTVYCHYSKMGVDWGLIGWIRRIILSEKIDVVHAHQYPAFFYGAPAAFLAGRVKCIYTEHGRLYPDKRHWKRCLVNPVLAASVDHLVSISLSTAKAMADIDNLPSNKIKIINNGVDICRMMPALDQARKRRELSIGETCQIIGTAARLEPIKNLPMMLRAFKRIHHVLPETCLIVAGDGSQMEHLVVLAADLGIADDVRFIGLRFDMPEIYLLMDVFLLTSFTEGISVTLIEAMASGVPGVVTDVGGNPEVVTDGVTGRLVTSDDDVMLAEVVVELLQNPGSAKALGGAGREKVLEKFSFETMIDSYWKLYC